jgi:uncharacterized phage protein gp47/JayE
LSTYIDLPIETDPQDIMDDFVTFMQAIAPGWTPAAGNLDVWLAQAMSLAAAESRDVASAVPRTIFRYFGSTLLNFAPIDDVSASTTTTWVVKDNAGYTIPLGTQISIAKTGDEVFAFETVADALIAPGATSISGVQVVAVTPGAGSSGLGAAGSGAQLIDPLAFVTAVTLEAVTAGGIDAETDDEYLGRLTGYLQLLAPRPILPNDFAVFARNIPGVFRATAIDGYDPITVTFNNARTVAVAAIDELGNPVSSATKSLVAADLDARREVNFVVNVIDPSIVQLDVTYTVKVLTTFDSASVIAAVNAALAAYLSPASWGAVNSTSDWTNIATVRYLEVANIINSVPGVDYITTTAGNYDLTIGLHGGGLARADIAMSGVAPLPSLVTATGTAT